MKFFSLIFLVTLLISCSGTKKVVSTTKKPEPTPKVETKVETKVTDTFITHTTKVIKVTDSLYVPDSGKEIEIIEKPIIKNTPKAFSHNTFNHLLQMHVSKTGNVNYKSLKKVYKKLKSYINELSENTPKNTWTREEKLAYWINAYNAMTIDLILRHYPIKSIKDIKDPWKQRFWKLGEKWYNLDDIEHRILRKMNEPRIHFAIVCASYSCPKLQNKAYTASNMEAQLTTATKEFLNDSERNSISKDNLELSKIFQWFAKDFKQNGSLIDFLNRYSGVEISNTAKKRFKDYSWDLNE